MVNHSTYILLETKGIYVRLNTYNSFVEAERAFNKLNANSTDIYAVFVGNAPSVDIADKDLSVVE